MTKTTDTNLRVTFSQKQQEGWLITRALQKIIGYTIMGYKNNTCSDIVCLFIAPSSLFKRHKVHMLIQKQRRHTERSVFKAGNYYNDRETGIDQQHSQSNLWYGKTNLCFERVTFYCNFDIIMLVKSLYSYSCYLMKLNLSIIYIWQQTTDNNKQNGEVGMILRANHCVWQLCNYIHFTGGHEKKYVRFYISWSYICKGFSLLHYLWCCTCKLFLLSEEVGKVAWEVSINIYIRYSLKCKHLKLETVIQLQSVCFLIFEVSISCLFCWPIAMN